MKIITALFLCLLSCNLAIGKESVKPLDKSQVKVVVYHAEWCTPCKRMEAEVWPNKEVKEALKKFKSFEEIDVDTEVGEKLVASQQIKLIPAIVFIDSKDEVRKKVYGFRDIKQMLSILKEDIKPKVTVIEEPLKG